MRQSGFFSISATAFGSQGLATFQSLLKFTLVFCWYCIIMVFVYTAFLKFLKTPVLAFFKQEAYTTAFFTSSSIASLPIAIRSVKKAGVSETTANFALPLGLFSTQTGEHCAWEYYWFLQQILQI
nr:cation:dicarboxylase symporter family transporter [Virgibacillus proomii]